MLRIVLAYHCEWQWVLELVDPLVFVHGGRLPREVGVSGVGGAGQELGEINTMLGLKIVPYVAKILLKFLHS